MKKYSFLLAVLLFLPSGLHAQQIILGNRMADCLFEMLMLTEKMDSNEKFAGDEAVVAKDAYPKTQFEKDSHLLKERLKAGYEYNLLGKLNEKGNAVYLYRIHPKDGGDDILCRMSVKNNKIVGVFFN